MLQISFKIFFGVLLVLLCILQTPVTLAGESFPGIYSFAGCTGLDCSACNVVDMVNGGLNWLIGVLFVVFAVLMAIAGVKLVTSGGNPGALSAAKDSFVNAIIGLIIILSAWLIVDTIMRGLLGNDGFINNGGERSGWLFWSEVECYEQMTPDFTAVETFWPGDIAGGNSNTSVTTTTPCAATPAGNVNCTQAEADCRATNGTPWIDRSNSTNYQVNCVAQDGTAVSPGGSGSVGCSGGACVPLTIPCARASSCSIAADMVSRLAAMHSQAGVAGVRVTEAMPPSRAHRSACHNNGTCIDYSKAGGMTGAEVARIISAARANGLRPVYEVVTQAQKDALVAGGAPASDIKVLGSWISAPHFSIYAN